MSTRLLLKFRLRPLVISSRCFYDSITKHDTIYAPLTTINSPKGSPLSVIRVSGVKTGEILSKLIRSHKLSRNESETLDATRNNVEQTQNIELIRPRRATLVKMREPVTDELIDLGLVLWFPGPKSYTGEDSCEFHLHGSASIISRMLTTLGSFPSSRPAEPGEFTRRAVLNGKMSLLQAESLPDLIASQTDFQRKLALKGLDKATRLRYESWIEILIEILAHLEASIDFGEDELIGERQVVNKCIAKLSQLPEEIHKHIEIGSYCKQFIQNGFRVSILGRPNAGKSTLMNLLCRQEKSIVSDLSGTTRDIVEHSFDLGGHAITLCDTAGLKDLTPVSSSIDGDPSIENLLEKHGSVEREGIRRALEAAKSADLVLYMIDGGKLISCNDNCEIIREISEVLHVIGCQKKSQSIHLVVNKIDLNQNLTETEVGKLETLLKDKFNNITKISYLSCKTHENFDDFVNQFASCLNNLVSQSIDESRYDDVPKLEYVNERHLSLLTSAHRHLFLASKLDLNTIDEMAQHVRESVDYLSRIVGSVSNEQVFDVIFRDFCIGK